jgi:hypothetical protein
MPSEFVGPRSKRALSAKRGQPPPKVLSERGESLRRERLVAQDRDEIAIDFSAIGAKSPLGGRLEVAALEVGLDVALHLKKSTRPPSDCQVSSLPSLTLG